MKLIKYDGISDKSVKAILASGGSSSSDNSDVGTRGGSDSLNRTIWGQNDTGDDVDGSMTVNGNISIKCIIPPSYEDDDSDDGEDEELEEGGGNLDVELKITANEVEAKDIYATRHLFINYPNHPEHSASNKKCIGEILSGIESNVKANADNIKTNQTNIKTNTDNIKANKDEIDKLKDRVSTNEGKIQTNADEIKKLKSKTDETASAVNDMMPVGSIIMFNGEADKIPDNWHICDGTAGTPDLIDKFIKASDKAGTTGGNNSIKLTKGMIPKMELTIDSAKLASDKEWKKRLNKIVPTLDEVGEYVFDKGGSSHYTLYTGYNEGDKGLLGVNYTTVLDDVRDYTYMGEKEDSQTALDIQPSYYSLIYIMKIK